MENIILTQVPLDTILNAVRKIVQEELNADVSKTQEEKLLSPAEACKIYQPSISKVTLAKWTADGLIQDYRIGGRVYYKRSELIHSLTTLRKYKKPAIAS